ncbi:GntR family transcriptional regulator [Inconstantimicrobium mannanitabidum]|uniref:GntR family transcriptional regulator n=1 Tax=Inconstantimicrobium mannanitabidum TaxID=1604901 RepID=A0ACB5RG93_9CLOT|nr:GntR family transcriptional regulator [Clostridium sp. TW13]GKX68110.1 GntR family transcriptional regulator [Clostridium sp. TW13]
MSINFNTNEPIYIQIVRYFKEQIILGNYKSGDEIPSRRELAATLKVNPNTVQRAYKEMEDLGMIETVRNFQSTITTNTEKIQEIRNDIINEAVDIFMNAIKAINVNKSEVMNILEEKWKE